MALSTKFDAYLCTLPWAGSGIDWRKLPHRSLELSGASDDEAVEWARQTPMALHNHVLMIDSASEPGFVHRFEDAGRDFELLSPTVRKYTCAASTSWMVRLGQHTTISSSDDPSWLSTPTCKPRSAPTVTKACVDTGFGLRTSKLT